MKSTLRVLHVEDSENDVALLTRHLSRAGYELVSKRVDTGPAMRAALETNEWDVILCDYSMPSFNALGALEVLKELGVDTPFIIISGTVGETVAVEAMRAGAHDYLMKDNLVRLSATIERELHEAENRRARRRAEDALRTSESEIRALFAAMTDVILVFDRDGRHLKVAPSQSAHLYKPTVERVGKTLHEIFPRDEADFFLSHIHQALAKGKMHRLEYELEIEGRPTWFEGSVSPMSEESVMWIARDITEHKQADQEAARLHAEIERQRQRLDNIVSTVPGVVWEAWGKPDNAAQRIDFISEPVQAMLGYSVEEWLSTPNFWLNIVHPDDKERTSKTAAEAFALGRGCTMEFRWLKKDGSAVWVESNFVVIKDDEGRALGLRGVNTDISERKRAEAELRFQKSLSDSQTEASIDGILVVSDEQKVLSVNKRFVEIWSVSKEVLRSDATALKYVLDQLADPEEFRACVKHLSEHKQEESRDEIYLKDGRTLDRYSAPIKSDEGEYFGRVWFFRDITPRKQAEAKLRESEERYRELFESNPYPMWVFDLETLRFLAVNDAAVAHYGHSREHFLEMTIAEIRPPNDVPRLQEHLRREADGAGIAEWQHCKKDGTIIDVEISAQTLVFGRRDAQLVLALDVTARKKAEAALRESEERYRDLVENAHDIIYSHDLEGNYTSVNKAGEVITGYTREEALKLNLVETVAPEWRDKAKEMMRRKLAGEQVTAYEIELIAKDGRRVAVEVNTKLIYEKGKPLAVQGIARDVTERKQLEDQLRQAQKMEAIGQLAGGVAHDFNNLLTAINGYTSLALQKLDDENSIKPYLEEVKKAGDRATNLTRQLLAFGRKQILQPVALDLNSVVTDMNKMLRRLIGEDIELKARLASNLKRTKGDPGQIEQVLVNLVVNARDAMPRGGIMTIETANVQLDQAYARNHVGIKAGNYVLLAVSDTGYGMDEKTQARIFEPFFTTKEKGKGTGLGLSMVYGIVKQSGGSIWVYSEPGRGTSFKVYLPELAESSRVAEKEASPEETIPGGKETVLLVEDEEIVRGLTTKILQQAGYTVLAARGGDEALQLCSQQEHKIDLLLTDVVMPGPSGKEVAEQMTRLIPGIRVLFMSGYTDEAIVHHGVLDSNVEFIQKPFTPFSLSRKVREVLDAELVNA